MPASSPRLSGSAEEGGVNGLMLDLQWAAIPCLLPLLAMLLLMVVMPLSEPTRHGLALIAGGLSIAWMLYVSAIFVRPSGIRWT